MSSLFADTVRSNRVIGRLVYLHVDTHTQRQDSEEKYCGCLRFSWMMLSLRCSGQRGLLLFASEFTCRESVDPHSGNDSSSSISSSCARGI